MSGKITDTFHVVKKTESVSKHFPQKKVTTEAKVKADQGENTRTKMGNYGQVHTCIECVYGKRLFYTTVLWSV